MTTDSHVGRSGRRRHAAARGRILAAAASAGAAVLLVGVMGRPGADRPTRSVGQPTAVVVPRQGGTGTVGSSTRPVPPVGPTDEPPVTSSQAS